MLGEAQNGGTAPYFKLEPGLSLGTHDDGESTGDRRARARRAAQWTDRLNRSAVTPISLGSNPQPLAEK